MLEAPPVLLRIWLCLSLLLFAPTGGGLLTVIAGATDTVCTQQCQDDDEQGKCAPDCADCTCCGHVRSVAAPTTPPLMLTDDARRAPVAYDEDTPPSVDTDDILHVPIALLA
ncbi:hypothetical protein LZ198_29990 [Myxococcus sp. K15C18031901]|uniref:hypothetical protein n=1 Tax=Myxococcus dinghuensis TaxID=2906761 RepID=UPI0020A79C6A|nr:hypothetical protein [Myxococcus dinghuensis]MCP3103118.1 hypothetical protein [Myxococcus dinghuensis]